MGPRTWIAFAALLAALLALSARAVHADIDDGRYCSAQWRICVTTPPNWHVTEQTSYPNVLLGMVRRNPSGKMLLGAEKYDERITSLQYAQQTQAILEELGFKTRPPQLHSATGAYWLDFDNGGTYLRQAFLVADEYRYALTLSAPDLRTRSLQLRSFDYALRSIRIERGARERT